MKIKILLIALLLNSCAIHRSSNGEPNYVGLTENEILTQFGEPDSIIKFDGNTKIIYVEGQKDFLLNSDGKVYSYSSSRTKHKMTAETKGKIFIYSFVVGVVIMIGVIMSVGQ